MMRMNNINMKTTVKRVDLLETLRINKTKHKSIVQEAREGYVKRAKKELLARLERISKGEVIALTFALNPPQDYTEVYENSIRMLEWNNDELVVLGADEFRQLVRDEWDWTNEFHEVSASYSKKK